jgi:lactoylglutathione lyase
MRFGVKEEFASSPIPDQHRKMKVERVKYVIWAADPGRAVRFYRDVLGADVVKESEVISEVVVGGATIGIHGGGAGERTWTGLTFQVPDVVAGAQEVVAGGGQLSREPQPEGGEPPHLAMCIDPEGNEFMLTRKRGGVSDGVSGTDDSGS